MANTLRSFSMGLVVATISCGAVYFINSDSTTNDEVHAEISLSSDEMIAQLEQDGYLIRNSEEWETELNTVIDTTRQQVEAEFAESEDTDEETEEQDEEQEQEEAEEPEENNEETFLLIIRNGMTSFDVADELIRGNIIDNKQAFVEAAENQNLAGFLKPGAYEMTSGMTIAQIFEMIT